MTSIKLSAFALAIALPGLAMAQTAAPATAPTTAPAATATDWSDDAGITSRLEQGGYSDVKISRSGNELTIDATKDGKPTNLVYDTTTGALTTVDGAGYTIENSDPMAAQGAGSDTTTMGQSGNTDTESAPSGGGDGTDTNDSANSSSGGQGAGNDDSPD